MTTTKTKRLARRVDLARAQLLAAQGDHDAARALFAIHGIDYVVAVYS